ncbi:hypothetical protein GW835_02850 [archaeon]|nr:hypothetical protein [archaeon]NCP79480.1 hypothetical protein [archaeon]NCP97423.1 hypothetical protein [archaeon]NCQ07247.1 hypothetical protein [archaeon]NCQ51043.1 hypothetical protein [archaeon]
MFIDRIKIQRKVQPFFEKNVNEKRKAISPLIATILLVVVAIAIIGIVLSWGKGFTNTTLSSADNINTKNSFTGLVWSFETFGNNVLVENKSKQDLNITGYTINSLDHNGFWINSYHPLETTLSISPGTSNNVPLICMPEGKFILTLKTSSNENIPLNISPSKTLLGGTCEEYNVSLWEFAAETGSYEINEIALEQGNNYSNYNFLFSWTEVSATINDSNTFSSTSVGGITKQTTWMEVGKRYKLKISGTTTASGIVIFSGNNGTYIGSLTTGNFSQTFKKTILAVNPGLDLYIRNSSAGVTTITELSVIEIPPLPDFNTGTKYLQNTTSGTTAIESKQAYGEWEFDVYKGSTLTNSFVKIISDAIIGSVGGNSYTIQFNVDEALKLWRGGTAIMSTANSYISKNTWYRIKVARLQSSGTFAIIVPSMTTTYPKDTFAVFIKGGEFGDDWTLVDTTGGSGTNPVTDSTYTTSNYFVADLDVGDRIANIKMKESVD